MTRNSRGQFTISYWNRFSPFLILILTMIACLLLQWAFREQELLSPYVSSYTVRASEPEPTPEPTPTPNPWKTATITAYSCNGIEDEYHLKMNCPSLIAYGEPRTANGTKPVIRKTMACDPSNMGRTFEIEGLGEVKCTDTGGAIKGPGRFDLYVEDINSAYEWGTRYPQYKLVEGK